MTRYSNVDVRQIASDLTVEARALGMITETQTIEFQGGSAVNGVSPYLYVQDNTDEAGRRSTAYSFLPQFTYKDTARTIYRTLEAVHNTLLAVRRSFD
jgi:hypothetical protein